MASRQEEIREGTAKLLARYDHHQVWQFLTPFYKKYYRAQADRLLNYLNSQGCVIRGNGFGGNHSHLANYFEVEPLVEMKDGG